MTTMATDLVNLQPLGQMVLLAMGLATLPLGWLAWRQRGATTAQRLRALTLLTLFITFDLVLFGAFTRLTDSGLGCPDWPGCYGHTSPLGAQAHIDAAQTAMPTGPVTHSKAWVEMVHRYMATGVGMLLTVLMVWSLIAARRLRHTDPVQAQRIAPGWAVFTFMWVCMQGAFGALTVTWKLYPAIVTLHLLGGIGLLVLLAVQAQRHDPRPLPLSVPLRRAAWGVWALLVLQIALGGWVSTNYAVLACQDLPTCQGQWWPETDFAAGFTLLRPLGLQADGSALPFAALTAIHLSHRLMAVVVLAAVWGLAWALHRHGQQHDAPDSQRFARGLWVLGALQLLTGISNIVLGWPLLAAVLHTGGAAALITWTTALLARSAHAPAPQTAASGTLVSTGLRFAPCLPRPPQ